MEMFFIGLIAGWISMILLICLTGNMRTRVEQEVVLSKPLRVFSPLPPPPISKALPGPISLPNGTVLKPGDYIRFQDLCEMMPSLLDKLSS